MTDPDDNLTPRQRTRQALHRSIDHICRTWPRAQNDFDARGYSTGHLFDAGAAGASIIIDGERVPVTSVEAVALNPSHAVAWIAELAGITAALADLVHADFVDWTPETGRQPMHQAVEAMCWDWPPGSEKTTRRIIRLASTGQAWWPPPLKAGHAKTKTGLDAEPCLYCQIDAYPGDRRAIKSPDGVVDGYVHRSPCWYAVVMSRGTHPRQCTS